MLKLSKESFKKVHIPEIIQDVKLQDAKEWVWYKTLNEGTRVCKEAICTSIEWKILFPK